MRFYPSLLACLGLVALPQTAQAACSHNGISYSVGATICSGGWLQECTPAGYWKAIGQCLKQDKPADLTQLQSSSAGGHKLEDAPSPTYANRAVLQGN